LTCPPTAITTLKGCSLPFPTELCTLCAGRTKKGLEPACVKHCMAACMKYGRVEELAKEMGQKPRMVLWSPR